MVRTMYVARVEAEMRWAARAGGVYDPQIITRNLVLVDAYDNEVRLPVTGSHLVGERFKVTIEPELEAEKEGPVGRLTVVGVNLGGDNDSATLKLDLLGKGEETLTLSVGDFLELMAPATLIRISKA